MKDLLTIPHKGIKTLINASWISYLYHLIYFGLTTFILLGLSLTTQLSLGSLIGYLLVVLITYVLLTSFLLRLLTGETGSKKKKTTKSAKKVSEEKA